MEKEQEKSIDEVLSREAEEIASFLEDPEVLDYFSLLSPRELDWTKKVWDSLSPRAKPEVEYESYRLSPKKREEIRKAKNRHKNLKSKVKMKAVKESIDLARIAWIHREYTDDALKIMYPLSAIEHIVKTLVFRFGYDYAVVIASAIEDGMKLSQMVALPEYPDMFEFSVPVTVRVRSETAGQLGIELWRRVFEKLTDKQSATQESQ